jgi:signal transduction histidine kinase
MKKILIIDDELDIRESLVDILSFHGYQTITVANGKEGLVAATTQKPDLILSDVSMPEMNGFELLEYLQENNILASVPFVFLTANNELTSLRKGMTLGADDYLTKPVEMQDLLNVVDRRLKRAEAIKKQFEAQYKDVFTDLNKSASHEFNTPLNGILGFAQLILMERTIELDSLKMFAEAILKSGYRLKDTLDNILLTRNLITKSKDIYTANCYLEIELLKNYAVEVAKKYERLYDLKINDLKNIEIKIDNKDFKKIYTELIDNAFKFSKSGKTVEVSVSEDDKYVKIIFTDNGRGMSNEQISEIGAFRQFERKIFEQQGLGLGLFIVNKIIELYSGKLEISNKTDSNGLICTLYLPK